MAEWFAPRRYGLGTGWPIAWQGWAVLAAFMAIVVAAGLLLEGKPGLQATIVFLALAALVVITAKTTRGGWRWRWGDKE
jgi:hypothetical protein